jgi:hypothetical protein
MSWQHLVIGVGILVTMALGSTKPPVPVSAEGSVHGNAFVVSIDMQSGRERDVFMLVDEERSNRAPDGIVDRVFRLQGEAGTVDSISRYLAGAHVTWTPTYVTAVLGKGDTLTFATMNSTYEGLGAVVRGFGLAHTRSLIMTLPDPTSPGAPGDVRANIMRLLGNCDGEHECTAYGGTGCSYSCGGEQCSITCSPPQVSCCFCGSNGTPCCTCVAQQ